MTTENQDRTAGRVALAQGHARSTLLVAVAFAVAAPVSALVPHDTGAWLPLHLFLVGAVLSAISGATQLLAVTWSAAPAPGDRLVSAQRWCVAAGAVAVAAGRELDLAAVTGSGAVLLVAALVLLASILLGVRRRSTQDRYHPAIDAYLLALVFGVLGLAMGASIASGVSGDWWTRLRAAHLTVNVLGLVGLVLAGTLPYFVATQARMKMSPSATASRMRRGTGALALATAVGAIGHLVDRPGIAAAGLLAYAGGLLAVIATLPRPGRRQLDWAGPRLVQLAAGMAWWTAMVAALGVVWLVDAAAEDRVLRALAVGGLAQVMVASLAYLGPVVRAGGHERLSAGFATTASWPGVVLGNATAVALLLGTHAVAVVTALAWAIDTGWRAARLFTDDGPGPLRR